MTSSRALKYKFIKTKRALDETIKRILDINRKRKESSGIRDESTKAAIAEELKVLNATADIQARALRRYEAQLQQERA